MDFTFNVEPSQIKKNRKQIVVKIKADISTKANKVYSVLIENPESFWEWMVDRSDPNIQIEVSKDWPSIGSNYRYRRRSILPFIKWETGLITITELLPLKHIKLIEEQYGGYGRSTLVTEYILDEQNNNTVIQCINIMLPHNYFMNYLSYKNPKVLSEQFQIQINNIIKVCENEK